MVKRVLGFFAGAALIAALAGCGTPGGTISVDAIFKQLGDLPRFAMVQSADVVIGSVRAIKLDGYNARVTLRATTNRIATARRLPRSGPIGP